MHCSCPYASSTIAVLHSRPRGLHSYPQITPGLFLGHAPRTVGYYRTAAASYGFQAGVKKFGYALFFMTDSALAYLDASGGWAIGTGPSVVVVDQGAARSLTTTNLRSDVYAFVFSQKGLMGGIGLEGSKITKITSSE